MKDTAVNNVIVFGLIIGAFGLGFMSRGFDMKREVKEETIKRMAYALQSGMLTVNHDKIVEISKANKMGISNSLEVIHTQVDTNPTEVKSGDNSEDLDSSNICTPGNENKIKLPEEG